MIKALSVGGFRPLNDAQSILNLWRKHLFSLLNGSENETPGDGEPYSHVSILDCEEVRTAIARLKNNKAARPMDCRPS